MSTTLLVVNMAGAIAALAANVWAALTGPTSHRPIRAAVAVLAAIYVGLYLASLFGGMTETVRVALAQGVGPAVWLLVWVAPAIRSTLVHHRNIAAIRELIDSVGVQR